jgi:hypothetical protein
MKIVNNWNAMFAEKIIKQINIRLVSSMPLWIAWIAVITVIGAFWSTAQPVFASERHSEYCSGYVGDIVKKYNLKPSKKTNKKAYGLCMDFKESQAKKVLLKSPKKATGRAVRNVMGRCLDVAGGVNADRTNVQIYKCNGTKSQKWTYTGKKEIRNVMGRCLDVAGGVNANRTNVQIYKCNGTSSQKWKFTKNREFRNVKGRCLEVAGGVNANGTNVQIFDCNGTKSQKWKK